MMNLKNKIINAFRVSALAALAVFQVFSVSASAASSVYNWSGVTIGGGGYTTGILIHPKEPGLMYARSDVGGVFRWDAEQKSWKSLLDMMGYDQKKYFGVDGFAIDPNNSDVLYIAVGKNWNNTGDILKSTDRGETWKSTNFNKKFFGNGLWRYTGELIAVDPSNSDIVYAGTRCDGLYKSEDGALSWNKITGVPAGEIISDVGTPGLTEVEAPIGTRSVVFDSTSEKNGASQIIYASVVGKGIYQTKDAGLSWTLLSGSPTLAARMEVSSDGVLYVTTLGQGVKSFYNGVWTDITPPDSDLKYCGLSIDPANSANVIVSRWANTGECTELPVYRSSDKGSTWEKVAVTTENNCKLAPAWFPAWFFLSSTSQVIFDPHNPGRVYAADWYSVWKTPDIWKNPSDETYWYAESKGLENTCVLTLSAPHSGANLIVTGADFGAHRYTNLNSFPESDVIRMMANINSVDFCESNPDYMVMTGSKFHNSRGNFVISDDNGKTFTEITLPEDARNGRVAYSAENTKRIVWVPQGKAPLVTNDRGVTWSETSGAPEDTVTDFWLTNQPLASDRVNGDTFYLLRAIDGETNEFYRSEDGGETWKMVNNTDLDTAVPWFWPQVKTAPGIEGEVWISQSTNGLYRSSDGGNTFTKIENVQTARLVAFGKNPPGKNHPTVFVQGTVNGISDGVFRSDDMGRTWIKINDSNYKIGNVPNSMEGDRQVFGRVYIGTNGSGVYCGEAVSGGVCSFDFADGDILSFASGGADITDEMLYMPSGAEVSGINIPKNSSVEFDIKAAYEGEEGSFIIESGEKSDKYPDFCRITYNYSASGGSFVIESCGTELGRVDNSAEYSLSSAKASHIKYVMFKDRVGIYFNGKLIKTVSGNTVSGSGASFELSFANENGEAYIDNLKAEKAEADTCRELYEKIFIFDDFNSGVKPWYANSGCSITDGALKISGSGKFSAYTAQKDVFIECDLSFRTDGDVTDADSEKVYTLEWNVRKTWDGKYYHLINVRYNPYRKTINVQVTKIDNGTKIWVGEKTVSASADCRLKILCEGDEISVSIDGSKVYSWTDDLGYPSDAKYSITERSWENLSAEAYVLMDNYKVAYSSFEKELSEFVNELTFHRNDGGVITGDERLKDGVYTLRTGINNFGTDDKNAVMLVGIYKSGILSDVISTPVTAEKGSCSLEASLPFELGTAYAGGGKIKLKGFVFDKISTMLPLAKSAAIADITVTDSTSPVIYSFDFDNGKLPEEFDGKTLSVENGMLKVAGGEGFTFSGMHRNCSVEFKIIPAENDSVPQFSVQTGNGSFTFYDNNRQNSSWSDKISLYNSITWGNAVSTAWANGTFFGNSQNGYTVKCVSKDENISLYINGSRVLTGKCAGNADDYKVIFSAGSNAENGIYLDDITVENQ